MMEFSSISKMNDSIPTIAENLKVDLSDLAISDFFYITIDGDKESAFASLQSDTFENLLCLLRYDGSSWVVVEAEMDGYDVVKFEALPGAYAAVVSTGKAPDRTDDEKKDNWVLPVIIIASVVAAAAIAGAVAFFMNKKKPAAPVATLTQPTFKGRKKGRKVKGNTQRNRNRQRKKKRDKKRKGKSKKHG